MSVDVAKHIITNRHDPLGIPFDWALGKEMPQEQTLHSFADYCDGLVSKVELLESGLLIREDTLDSAVIMSLFSDARAKDDTKLPLDVSNKRGWCGDEYFNDHGSDWGSLMWTRYSSKTTEETRRFMVFAAKGSLQHLVDNNIAERVEVDGNWRSNSLLALEITIYKADTLAPPYAAVWGLTISDHKDTSYANYT